MHTAQPGFYCDGRGLNLRVDPSGARRWVQRLVIRDRPRMLGLGGYPLVSLAEARDVAFAHRKQARAGGDPLTEQRHVQHVPTVEEAAAAVLEQQRRGWRNAKYARDWPRSLRVYAFPRIGARARDPARRTESARQWWSFEGFTEVDCCLETDKLVLLIEGKRTESLSESTAWYSGRNQLHRNLEAARDLAAGREFGVFVIGEEEIPETALGSSEAGLPHLNTAGRAELMSHYLGTLTWSQVCQVTGIDYRSLPRTWRGG